MSNFSRVWVSFPFYCRRLTKIKSKSRTRGKPRRGLALWLARDNCTNIRSEGCKSRTAKRRKRWGSDRAWKGKGKSRHIREPTEVRSKCRVRFISIIVAPGMEYGVRYSCTDRLRSRSWLVYGRLSLLRWYVCMYCMQWGIEIACNSGPNDDGQGPPSSYSGFVCKKVCSGRLLTV